MIRDERLRDLHAVVVREHRAERLDLHLAEARAARRSAFESPVSAASRPDPRRVAAVLVRDDRCQLAHARRHRAREPVDRRLLAERLVRSSAASFFGSSVRRRCLSTSGPANAFCTGTCWSIANPTSSANGSFASSSHAFGIVGELQSGGHELDVTRRESPAKAATRGECESERKASRQRGWSASSSASSRRPPSTSPEPPRRGWRAT